MRRIRAFLVLFLLCLVLHSGIAGAMSRGEFVRLVIPKIGMTAPIVLLEEIPGSWEDLPYDLAGQYEGESNLFGLHRGGVGRLLESLEPGDEIRLYRDWEMTSPRLWLRVVGFRRVLVSEFWRAVETAGGDTFFFVTCHPPGGPPWPQRLIIEAQVVPRTRTRLFRGWR